MDTFNEHSKIVQIPVSNPNHTIKLNVLNEFSQFIHLGNLALANSHFREICDIATNPKEESMENSCSQIQSDSIDIVNIPDESGSTKYMITSIPTIKTICDFWNVILMNRVTNILMLKQIPFDQDAFDFLTYLPAGGISTELPNGMKIRSVESRSIMDGMKLTDLVLHETSNGATEESGRKLKYICFDAWPSKLSQLNCGLFNQIREILNSSPRSTTMIIYPKNELWMPGIFCVFDYNCASIEEGRDCVDIFDYIVRLKKIQPSIIINHEQYVTLHRLVLEYLDRKQNQRIRSRSMILLPNPLLKKIERLRGRPK